MPTNPICSFCRFFFSVRCFQRNFIGNTLFFFWQMVWKYELFLLLCPWLLSNGACGKEIGLRTRRLIGWFKTKGKDLVTTYVALDPASQSHVDLVTVKDGKVVKVGQIRKEGKSHDRQN